MNSTPSVTVEKVIASNPTALSAISEHKQTRLFRKKHSQRLFLLNFRTFSTVTPGVINFDQYIFDTSLYDQDPHKLIFSAKSNLFQTY